MSKSDRNQKDFKKDLKRSLSRLKILTIKTIKRFYRNPKGMAFLVLIPIMYYIILGLIFGGTGAGGISEFHFGWIDDDSTEAVTHPQYDLDLIYNSFENIDNISLTKFDSKEDAQQAALDDEIDAYIYFPEGFEGSLEEHSYVRIGFINNDSTSSGAINVSKMYNNLKSQTSYQFIFTNLTGTSYENPVNLKGSNYDGLFFLNDKFSEGIENDWNVNMSYYYKQGLSESKLYYVTGTISTSIDSYFDTTDINSTVKFSIRDAVPGTSIPDPVTYEIYFLQTISPTTRSIIQQMVDGVINGIINQNPTEIELNYEVKSAKGQEVNQLSYSAPGYILYGPMTILSFALIVLTSEKKDGIYKRLSSSEVRNYEIILSNILADTLLIFIQLIIGCVILLLFGWSPVIFSLTDAIIGTILAVFLFSFFILALAFALAPVFKDPDTAGGGVWVILIPLMMISGIFVPIEFFGEYMQNIAAFLPTRYAVIIFQNLFLKGLPVTDPSTLLNMGLLLIYSIVIFIIGVFAFKKFK